MLRTLPLAALVAASSAADITGTVSGYADAACTTLKAGITLQDITFNECVVGGGTTFNTPAVTFKSHMYGGSCGVNAVTSVTYATADCTGTATPDAFSARLLNGFITLYKNKCVPVTVTSTGQITGYSKYTCAGTAGNAGNSLSPSAWALLACASAAAQAAASALW